VEYVGAGSVLAFAAAALLGGCALDGIRMPRRIQTEGKSMVGKHVSLAMVAGLAVGVSVGLVNVHKVQAESKIPVRTAVLTSSDQAAVQATPVHWGHGGYYGGWHGGYGGWHGGYGGWHGGYGGWHGYYGGFYRPYYAYYRPYYYRPYYAPYYVYPSYYAAYPSVYAYSYPRYEAYPFYGVVPYGGYYYW
jgi:hypothetical protein